MLGNGPLPYRAGLLRVHDALAWLAQIGMFLILGLLVFPTRLLEVAAIGLGLALLLAIVIRPLVVALCLAAVPLSGAGGSSTSAGSGLRGAVPIVLATYPVLVGAPGAGPDLPPGVLHRGGERAGARRDGGLGDSAARAAAARAAGAAGGPGRSSHACRSEGELMSFYIDEALVVAGVALRGAGFSRGAAVALIVRGDG